MRALLWLLGFAAALATAAAMAQQQSPLLPPSAPLAGLDGKSGLASSGEVPIPDAKGGAGPQKPEKVRSVEPPRPPVQPPPSR